MIQPATINHLNELSILFDAYRQFYNKGSDIESAKLFLADRMNNNESKIFIAFEGEEVVGFIQLYPLFSSTRMKRFWILNDLFVSSRWRGKGFSKALIEEAKELCYQTDACGMLLETSVINEIGNILYPSMGFVLRDDANFYEWEVK